MNKQSSIGIIYLWPFQFLSILGILYSFYEFKWWEILIFLLSGYIIGSISQLIALHRYFSHRSYEVNEYWKFILTLISTLSISGPIVVWANTHRNHHKHSDTQFDPHSPKHRGMVNVFFANWWYYKHAPVNTIRDYNKDPLLKFTFDYYYHINILFILGLYLINPYLLFPLYFYPGIIGPFLSSVVNTYLHRDGTVHDSKTLSWIISGDGHHKFHHEHPGNAILPFPDACGILINLIKKDKNE